MKTILIVLALLPLILSAQLPRKLFELPKDSFLRIERVPGHVIYPTKRNFGISQLVTGDAVRFDSVFLSHYWYYPDAGNTMLAYDPIPMTRVTRKIAKVKMKGTDRVLDLSKKYFFISEDEMQP